MFTTTTTRPDETRVSTATKPNSAAHGRHRESDQSDILKSIPLGVWLILPASVLFIVGILAPSVVVNEFGNTRQLSLLDGIQVLWATGHAFLAIVIFLFTVLFPPVKLALTAAVAIPAVPLAQSSRRRFRRLVEALGRWSLLDVLVIAILIVTIKVRGVVSVKATWGICAFALSIGLSMVATHFLKAGRSNPKVFLRCTVTAAKLPQAQRGLICPANGLTAVALAILALGVGWLFLAPTGTVDKIHVTRKDTFIELPRLFGNPSFYLRIRTLQGIQRLDTKTRTPIGNGLVWTLEQPVPLASIYEAELFEDGILSDKLVDRVAINDRREVGQRFQFQLKGRRDWQRPTALFTAAAGIGLLIFSCRRTRKTPTHHAT